MTDVKVTAEMDTIKIHLNGVLHCYVNTAKLLGMSSWFMGEGKFCIEFNMEHGHVLLQYDNKEVWAEILKKLDPHLENITNTD